MPLTDALKNIATLGYYSYHQQLKLKQENFELSLENKSLRDQVGTSGVTGGLSTARVLTGMFKDNQEELFQKPTALQLRRYAEFSTWVRAALNIHRPAYE
jgi:hypothetical protein